MSSDGAFSALVVGPGGLVGSNVLQHLLRQGSRWSRVVAVYRRKEVAVAKAATPGLDLVTGVDFTSPEDVAELVASGALKGITHIFYCAWAGVPNLGALEGGAVSKDETESRTNLALLQGVISAAVSPSLRRIVCVHGTKWYGVHLGPAKCQYLTPFVESAPRNCPASLFYYTQQDWLQEVRPAAWWRKVVA